ncbi:MAG: glutamate racemase [Chitinophagales bacterium]|nr:glutamate racemase [Bacteroidota bacterium]MCB9255592.1 glutamate racemase [Chitinophagales bacterium]
MNNNPIGIFDSGIGGLTVANAISKAMPKESLVYFGDTAHLPYGEKSKDLIREYSLGISKFLLEVKHCKAIVIACNTASAAAYEYLRDSHKGSYPIINVIDPIIEALVERPELNKIGLIATNTTISSGVYQEKIRRRKPSASINTLATPLLVPMIEEGYANDNISRTLIGNYLSNEALEGIEALILGCTHYPIIRKEIEEYYEQQVQLFDSTDILANKLKWILEKEDLLCSERSAPNSFYISDMNPHFAKSAERFFQESINLELLNIWKEGQ